LKEAANCAAWLVGLGDVGLEKHVWGRTFRA